MVAGYFFSLFLCLGVFVLLINKAFFFFNIYFHWDTENLLSIKAGDDTFSLTLDGLDWYPKFHDYFQNFSFN